MLAQMTLDPQVTNAGVGSALVAALIYAAKLAATKLAEAHRIIAADSQRAIDNNTSAIKDLTAALRTWKPGPPLALLAAGLLTLGTVGCSMVKLSAPDGSTVTALVPAWPWQDAAQTVKRAAITTKGTNTSVSLDGSTLTTATNTNTLQFLQNVVANAIAAGTSLK